MKEIQRYLHILLEKTSLHFLYNILRMKKYERENSAYLFFFKYVYPLQFDQSINCSEALVRQLGYAAVQITTQEKLTCKENHCYKIVVSNTSELISLCGERLAGMNVYQLHIRIHLPALSRVSSKDLLKNLVQLRVVSNPSAGFKFRCTMLLSNR